MSKLSTEASRLAYGTRHMLTGGAFPMDADVEVRSSTVIVQPEGDAVGFVHAAMSTDGMLVVTVHRDNAEAGRIVVPYHRSHATVLLATLVRTLTVSAPTSFVEHDKAQPGNDEADPDA